MARLHPDAPAIVLARQDGTEETLSWAGLDRWSNRLARKLAAEGAGPGCMVAIALPNGLEHYACALAAWKVGACTLPLSPRMPDAEFDAVVALLDRKLVVGDQPGACLSRADATAARDDASLLDGPLPDVVPHPGKAIPSGGSTGRPKVIVDPRPWARVPGNVDDIAEVGFASGQVQLVAGPLYHNSPFSWSHYGLFEDHRLVLMERFDAARAMDLIERHRCQFMFLSPTMMLRIARLPGIERRDLSSIQAVFHTAAPCPDWLKRAWIGLVGAEQVYEGYGSSEATGSTGIRGDEWLLHPGSVGRARRSELRILDEAMQPVPAGEVGEVFFRPACHPAPTYRYIGAPPAKATGDGFISVGDMGRVDRDGYLFLTDRRVDLVITGGANVFPAEVEAALTEHPAIADAAVVGLPDPEWGRRVHAIIEPQQADRAPTGAELDAWLRARLTPYKLPKSYEVVPALPRDPSGKIRRSALMREREQPAPARAAP